MARTKQQETTRIRAKASSSAIGRKEKAAAEPEKPQKAGVKKTHRFRPGTVSLREIRRYQKSTDMLLRRAPFIRLIREIAQEKAEDQLRWTKTALQALQEGAETFMVETFQNASTVMLHRNMTNAGHLKKGRRGFTINPGDVHTSLFLSRAPFYDGRGFERKLSPPLVVKTTSSLKSKIQQKSRTPSSSISSDAAPAAAAPIVSQGLETPDQE